MTLPDFYEVTDRYQVVRYHTRIFDRRFVTTPPRFCNRRCGECYKCTHWRVGRHNWVGVPLGLLRYEIDTSEIKFVETHNRSGDSMLTMYRRKLHDRSTPYVKGMYDELCTGDRGMNYAEAIAVLEDRRYACFAYAAHAYTGAVKGMILVWSREGHIQMTYDPANHTWHRLGVIDDLGLESLLEASYWETGLLDSFKSV